MFGLMRRNASITTCSRKKYKYKHMYQYFWVNGVFLGQYTFHSCTAHVHVAYHGVTCMNCPKKATQPTSVFTKVCSVFQRMNRNTLTFPFTL